MRIGGPSFRRAVAASLALHVVLALGIILVCRGHPDLKVRPPRPIDTRVAVQVRFIPESVEVPVEAPPPVVRPEPDPSPPKPPAEPVEPVEPPRDSRPPVVQAIPIPRTLPPELLAMMRRSAAEPPSIPETPSAPAPAPPVPVEPVGGIATAPAGPLAGGLPIHGALPAGRSIVYVLDASGSMGEWGKFDVARRALVATLRAQPDAVRFQVIVYAGTAEFPVQVRGRTAVAATAANVESAITALEMLARPAGHSNHLAALRAALELEPDVVLILSDAADWPAANVRGMLGARPGVAVCVAKVTADAVGTPVAVK